MTEIKSITVLFTELSKYNISLINKYLVMQSDSCIVNYASLYDNYHSFISKKELTIDDHMKYLFMIIIDQFLASKNHQLSRELFTDLFNKRIISLRKSTGYYFLRGGLRNKTKWICILDTDVVSMLRRNLIAAITKKM